MSAVVQSPQLEVRPMKETDLDAVMKIELAMYPFPWTRRIFADCLRVGYRCFVGEVDGIFAGYSVMSVGAGEAHILNVCVAEEYHRMGLGRCLLNKMLEQASHYNVENVFLEVRPSNTAALKLYEQIGFNQIGVRKDYYPDVGSREDALVMAMSLVPWGHQGE